MQEKTIQPPETPGAAPCALFADYPDMMTARDISRAFGVSEQGAYRLMRGNIPTVKIGGRVFVPREMLAQAVAAGGVRHG